MSANLTIETLSDWTLLLDRNALILCTPTVLGGVALCVASRLDSTGCALPALLVAMPVAFFAVLLLLGLNLEDAAAQGWVLPIPPETTQ